jgi:hypothetical protein
MPEALRKTAYAELCAEASVELGGGAEVRLERLWVKGRAEEVMRLSWWKAGRMVPRPADLSEAQLITLLERGIAAGVLTPFFLRQLLMVMERNAEAVLEE